MTDLKSKFEKERLKSVENLTGIILKLEKKLAITTEAIETAYNESSWPLVKKVLYEALEKTKGESDDE